MSIANQGRGWRGVVVACAMIAGGCSGKDRKFVSGTGEVPPDEGSTLGGGEIPAAADGGPGAGGPGVGAAAEPLGGLPTDSAGAGDLLGMAADEPCLNGGSEAPCVASPASCDPSAGACVGVCPGCSIEGVCLAAGATHPDNICLACDPSRSSAEWSSDEGKACDDGLFCTVEDACSAGVCAGAPRECEDGVACNGASRCEEEAQRCAPDENQCAGSDVCDVASDTCVSTCESCLIANVCVSAGSALAGNPCMVCDPARSTTAYSPSVGSPCGAAATTCSAQDTCDPSGVCQANHAAVGSPCGNPASSECNGADSCDGNGNCSANLASNGAACNDGQFCTAGDACQGGGCVAARALECGNLRACNEAAGECRCTGCTVGGACIAAGTPNASNPCQVCDPARSATAFSPKGEGAFCGSGEQCSATSLCRFTGMGLVSAGFWDTCVIKEGEVFCVSAGGPIDLGADTTALQISTGQHHTCALLANGGVRCWGDTIGSDRGQLGAQSIQSAGNDVFIGTVELGGRAVFLSAGTDYNCAVLDTGAVRCWGLNTVGQLGYGHTRNIGDGADDFPLVDVNLGGRRAIQVDAGNNHTCAVLDGGALSCWGRGFGGALGYGNETDLLDPSATDVNVGAGVRQVSTGSAHTCALLSTGFLNCWGFNSAGELGYGHTQSIGDDETPAQAATRTVPRDPALPNGPTRPLGGNVDVGGSVVQVQIHQGLRNGQKTCVRLLGGALRCWGDGSFGGLGTLNQSDIGDNETPAEAATLPGRPRPDGSPGFLGGDLEFGGSASALAEGGDQCALRADGEVLCWRGAATRPIDGGPILF